MCLKFFNKICCYFKVEVAFLVDQNYALPWYNTQHLVNTYMGYNIWRSKDWSALLYQKTETELIHIIQAWISTILFATFFFLLLKKWIERKQNSWVLKHILVCHITKNNVCFVYLYIECNTLGTFEHLQIQTDFSWKSSELYRVCNKLMTSNNEVWYYEF